MFSYFVTISCKTSIHHFMYPSGKIIMVYPEISQICILFVSPFLFWDRISCSSGWSQIHYVSKCGVIDDSLACILHTLGIQVWGIIFRFLNYCIKCGAFRWRCFSSFIQPSSLWMLHWNSSVIKTFHLGGKHINVRMLGRW